MDKKKLSAGAVLTALIWAVLTVLMWFGPSRDISETERRPLAQMPVVSAKALLDGSFMEDFEAYTLDQFPLRDSIRMLKSLFHFYGLNQSDNNDIYLARGHAVKQEYPLKEDSLAHAVRRFDHLYSKYLADSGSAVYMAVVPDKGYYLAQDSGHLAMDYEKLMKTLEECLPWANFISLTESLTAEDYYRTDIHWRQEGLLAAAQTLCEALGVTAPEWEDYTLTALDRPFYGVYYGQAALPMEPDTMYLLESDLLENCRVYDYESGTYSQIYNRDKLDSRDLYDVFLSGSRSLLTIENPAAGTDRELIVFRDSFGSSMVPLLLADYAKVTLVDIRYIQIDLLGRYLTFSGQDVLLLYSTSVLNNSQTIK